MFGRALHVENQRRTYASFCHLSNVDIFQHTCITQCSTCAEKKYAPFDFDHASFMLIYIGNTCMYVGHLQKQSFNNAGLAQSIASLTMTQKVVGSSPTLGKNFSFCIFASLAFLAVRLSQYK